MVFVEAWVGVIYRHWLTEDVATAYVAGLFHLLLGKIAASPSAKEPLAAANKPAGDDTKGADSEHVSEQPSESEEVSMFGNDLIRSYNMMMWTTGAPLALSGLLGGIFSMVYIIGLASSAIGLSVTTAIILANVYLTKAGGKTEHVCLKLADLRISILNEILESARFIKFFVWEDEYVLRAIGAHFKIYYYSPASRPTLLARGSIAQASPTRQQLLPLTSCRNARS